MAKSRSVMNALLLLLIVAPSTVLGCLAPNASDALLLQDNPHLRDLFTRYGEGGVISPDGLLKLLRHLGVSAEHAHHGDHDHHDGDEHVTHDHNPDHHGRNDHVGHDHSHSGAVPNHPEMNAAGKEEPNSSRSNHLEDDPRLSSDLRNNPRQGDHHPNHDDADNESDTLRLVKNNYHRTSRTDSGDNDDDSPNFTTSAGASSSSSTRSPRDRSGHNRTASRDEHGDQDAKVGTKKSSGGDHSDTIKNAASGEDSATPSVPPSDRHKMCDGLSRLFEGSGVTASESITVRGFVSLCPGLINYLDVCIMDHHHHSHSDEEDHSHHHNKSSTHLHDHSGTGFHCKETGHSHHHSHSDDEKDMSAASWIGALTSMVVIGLVGLGCIMIIPALKRSQYYDQVNHFLLALAVGTLAGDALIHLLPHAISMDVPQGSNVHLLHAFYGFTALGGIILFLFLERCHNLMCGHGHSHTHGHGLDLTKSKEDLDKETVGTATTTEEMGSQSVDKIGEKLSKHSKHNSFIYAESTMSLDAQNCFEGCSANVSPSSDANGNNGLASSRFGEEPGLPVSKTMDLESPSEKEVQIACIEKQSSKSAYKEKMTSSLVERERLVTPPADKSDTGGDLSSVLDTPSSGRPKVLRQNSSSFNMVLQEYHVGHHGHSHHGHSHVTGRKDSLRAMILVGDAMHTFLDGMAIGAAFGAGVMGGIATSIAVLCHELPHKVGDFALLFEMGMHLRQAVKMMGLLWLLSLLGVIMGVVLGSIPTATPWIYSFTAGVFIYLALVDLLSELSVQRGEVFGSVAGQMFLQGLGMFMGAFIMLMIAIYEHDLKDALQGSI